MHIKTCEYCGKEFEAKRKDAKFCGNTCQKRAKRGTKLEVQCPICGKIFVPTNGNQKYCTEECKKYGYDAAEIIGRLERLYIIHAIKEDGCNICGKQLPDHAIDLHHIIENSKEINPGQLSRYTTDKLLNEIIKCIPVCPTCHRLLHRGTETTYIVKGIKIDI